MADVAEGVRTIVGNRDLVMFTSLGMAQTFTRGALTVFTVVAAFDLLRTGEPGVGTLTAAVGRRTARFSRRIPVGGNSAAGSVVWCRHCVVGAAHRAYRPFPRRATALGLLACVGFANAPRPVHAYGQIGSK